MPDAIFNTGAREYSQQREQTEREAQDGGDDTSDTVLLRPLVVAPCASGEHWFASVRVDES